jgi:hypothetical protein
MDQFVAYGTAAANGEMEFKRGSIPASIILDVAAGWAGSETIPVYYVGLDGVRLTPVLDSDGAAFAFSATNKVLPLYFPCRVRAVKPTSVAGMGLNWLAN